MHKQYTVHLLFVGQQNRIQGVVSSQQNGNVSGSYIAQQIIFEIEKCKRMILLQCFRDKLNVHSIQIVQRDVYRLQSGVGLQDLRHVLHILVG